MALDFAAGCVGGAAGVLVGFPLDTVKVRIQTQSHTRGTKCAGTFQCLSSIVKQEGVASLYRGISSPVAGVAVINAICFGVYGNVNRRLSEPNSIASITTAGAVSGFVQAFACSPMELIKTRMQISDGKVGVIDTAKAIVKKSGVTGLFKGLGLTIAREVPAFSIYFCSYEYMVRGREDNTPLIFAAGGLSGVASWLFTYPQDVIKSRIQADSSSKYKGALHCLKLSIEKDGYGILSRGIMSTVIRAFPTNATTMAVVTLILRSFGEEEKNVYETLARIRTAESFYFELPSGLWEPKYKYYHNVCTLATDGLSIVHIANPKFAIDPYRLYVERMLTATPTKYLPRDDPSDVDVGTIRSSVSLGTFKRIVERRFSDDYFQQGFMNVVSCLGYEVLEPFSLRDLSEEKTKEKSKDEKEASKILLPSLLGVREGERLIRESHITTSDFLNASSLLSTTKKDRIYGFYYLVC